MIVKLSVRAQGLLSPPGGDVPDRSASEERVDRRDKCFSPTVLVGSFRAFYQTYSPCIPALLSRFSSPAFLRIPHLTSIVRASWDSSPMEMKIAISHGKALIRGKPSEIVGQVFLYDVTVVVLSVRSISTSISFSSFQPSTKHLLPAIIKSTYCQPSQKSLNSCSFIYTYPTPHKRTGHNRRRGGGSASGGKREKESVGGGDEWNSLGCVNWEDRGIELGCCDPICSGAE